MVNYQESEPDFYDSQLKTSNILRNWFHNSRSLQVNKFIKKYYRTGDVIVDLGCGNVMWNVDKLPVIGVDINTKFLEYSKEQGRITEGVACYLDNIKLADESANIVIITEVLEHLPDCAKTLQEIRRILKKDGIIISSVPYDTFFSFWQPLFALQCFYRGVILKDSYYQEKCGHINHFSPQKIKQLFLENNFSIVKQHNHFYFTIFTIVRKLL
jgi:ubiquinone/menaquinone biosynthesis C-methylase UbiE